MPLPFCKEQVMSWRILVYRDWLSGWVPAIPIDLLHEGKL